MFYKFYMNNFIGNRLVWERVTGEYYREYAHIHGSCGFVSKDNVAKDIPVLNPVQDAYCFFPIECNLVDLINYLERKGYDVTGSALTDTQIASSQYLVLLYERVNSSMVITNVNPSDYTHIVSRNPDRILFFPEQIVDRERRG